MTFLNGLLKFYAYIFHLALCIFLITIAIIATKAHQPVRMEMLPFDQNEMIARVSLLSLIGFICIFLAFVRIFEFVFPIWSLAVIVILFWGFFFTPYTFNGPTGLEHVLLFILAAIVAFYGSVRVLIPDRPRYRW